jgi:hypothetical protein
MLFSHVSCGYGLIPLAGVQALSPEITNWGKDDYDDNKPIGPTARESVQGCLLYHL